MKKRMRTVWALTFAPEFGGAVWLGDCPSWAAQAVPRGATLTSQRVLWLGPPWFCECHNPDVLHGKILQP
jgi:hypothetical protein